MAGEDIRSNFAFVTSSLCYNGEMQIHISEEELTLLTYLHEHAAGYEKSFSFEAENVKDALNLESKVFSKAASFLVEYDLIGIEKFPPAWERPSPEMSSLWLSARGEHFMRELEKSPSIGRKLTVGAIKELWDMGKGIVAGIAAQQLVK